MSGAGTAAERAPFLNLRALVKEFGGVRAVDGISLEVHQGEIFALLGPSGCGKTTLLRILAGFEAPTSGEVVLDGQSLAGLPPYLRPINMMFQSYALFPHLSVRDNVAFGLERERLPQAEIAARVQALGMTYTYLPFMVLPLYATFARLDLRLLEAAADLGATPWTTFVKVTVPLSRPGLVAGSMLVFIPCVGEYVIPELLGGPETLMIGRVLWDELFSNGDWPMAASVAVVVVLLVLVPLALFNYYQGAAREAYR